MGLTLVAAAPHPPAGTFSPQAGRRLAAASYSSLARSRGQLSASTLNRAQNFAGVEDSVRIESVLYPPHVGELVRGALQSIPKGQTEAAKAIGLTFAQTFAYVLGPQALRQALPAWVNTAAEMVKASTLLSIIGVGELLLRTQEVISRTFMVTGASTADLAIILIDSRQGILQQTRRHSYIASLLGIRHEVLSLSL